MRFFDVIKSRKGKPLDFSEIEGKVAALCEELGILLFYVFGSYAGDSPGVLSDVDVAVLCASRLDLESKLRLIGRLQDLFEDEAIDLVDLRSAPVILTHRIFGEGRCVYAKDLRTRIDFESWAETRYFDMEPMRKSYFHELKKRIEDGAHGDR